MKNCSICVFTAAKTIAKKIDTLRHFWLIVLFFVLFIATSWSLFVPGMFRVHDYVHGARIAEVVRAAQAGHIPVRWSEHFGYGYGMPLYIFYAPLPYYFGGFVYWLSGNLIWSVKSLFLVANIGAILGGYFLGKRVTKTPLGGVIGAIIFALAPYRALNLFVRGAISEAWAMMWISWFWYGLLGLLYNRYWIGEKVWQTKKNIYVARLKDWGVVVLASVGIMLSHNLTTLMAFSMTGLMLLVWGVANGGYAFIVHRTWKASASFIWRVVSIMSALVMGAGLSSFYLLPMYFEKNMIRTDIFLEGYFNFRLHFLYIRQFFDSTWGYGGSTWGPDDGISFFLGWPFFVALLITFILVFAFGCTAIKRKVTDKKSLMSDFFIVDSINTNRLFIDTFLLNRTAYIFGLFGMVSVVALFATLLKSQFIWEFLPLIENLQFPWRWLSITTLSLLVVVLIITQQIYTFLVKKGHKILAYCLVCSIAISSFAHVPFFTPELWLENASDLYYQDELRIQTHMSEIMLDYIPQTLVMSDSHIAGQHAKYKNGLEPFESLDPVVGMNSSEFSHIQVLVHDPHQKLVSVVVEEATTLIWPIADFPGWRTYVNGQEVEKKITETGLVSVLLEPGSHEVGVRFMNTPIRSFADAITIGSVLILVAGVLKVVGLKPKE